ncbi:hypothetical protein AVEN_96114-1 [Araneus ventricosus]|uniref:Uncharacterized protein n=1 Tax=Araneus ventricosus TaxID=182803 RepID=A0A4Y2Q9E1_ARAVE|nr:hypothetical protein AVEN_96114-1 [Araneus ventricosus]
MSSDGVNLLHDNTYNARKTQELMRKFKWEVWSPSADQIRHPIWVPDTYLEQGSLQSDGKADVDNWLNGQGRDFCEVGLNELVLRSDKCRNRFGDYVEQ